MSADLIALLAVGAVGVAGALYLILDDFWFRHRMRVWGDETLRRLMGNQTRARRAISPLLDPRAMDKAVDEFRRGGE